MRQETVARREICACDNISCKRAAIAATVSATGNSRTCDSRNHRKPSEGRLGGLLLGFWRFLRQVSRLAEEESSEQQGKR